MKFLFNKLVFIFILTSFFSEISDELPLFIINITAVEHHQTDKGPYGETGSPFCLDSSTEDFIDWNSSAEFLIPKTDSDKLFPRNVYNLRTFSKFIWQPPKIS